MRGNEQASSSSSSGLQSRTQQNLSSSSSSSSPAAVGQTKLRLTLRSPSKSFINTKAKAASSNDDDDDDDDDNEGNEYDDDDEDDDESPEQFGTRRYSSRTSSRNRFAVPSAHEDVQQKPATRMRLVMSRSTQSSQGGTDRKRRRGNDSDEQDEENDNDESESDDDEDERLNLRSKLGTSRRLATKKRVSYAEINDNEDDGAEDEDTSLKNRKASRSHSSSHSSSYHQVSSQSSTSDRSTRTREGAKYSSKVPEKASNTSSAHIEPTGRRPVRLDRDNLVRMNALVAKIEEGDVGGSFAEPVVEEDAPSYYEIIQQPMDLSTIK